MVWSCITYEGVGWFVDIGDETMKKEDYLKILKTDLINTLKSYKLREDDIEFMQDNDPKHTAGIVKTWLASRKFSVMTWPANSPDLNPIENMWHLLKTRLCKNYKSPAKNMDELFDRAADVWYSISKEECQKYIDTMPKRVEAVIKNKGLWIDY